MISYDTVILISWAAFLIVWAVAAFNVKRDVQGGGFPALWSRYLFLRLIALAFLVFIASRIFSGNAHYASPFSRLWFTPSPAIGWVGALLTAGGIAFAMWARVHLGRNWSSHPTMKENHELVTSGPYAYVRHPIYTGIILAALGYALVGSVVGAIGFVFALIVFGLRIGREEKIMLGLFPDQYPGYQARTKRLVPFLW